MSRVCTVCSHPDRANIDAALVSGTSYRNVAKRFSVGFSAVARHVDGRHIQASIQQAQAQQQEAQALDIVRQLDDINQVVKRIMYASLRDKKSYHLALSAADRILKQLDFQHRMSQLDELAKEVEALKQAMQENDA